MEQCECSQCTNLLLQRTVDCISNEHRPEQRLTATTDLKVIWNIIYFKFDLTLVNIFCFPRGSAVFPPLLCNSDTKEIILSCCKSSAEKHLIRQAHIHSRQGHHKESGSVNETQTYFFSGGHQAQIGVALNMWYFMFMLCVKVWQVPMAGILSQWDLIKQSKTKKNRCMYSYTVGK